MNKRIGALAFIAVIGTSSVGFAETAPKYFDSEVLTKIAEAAVYPMRPSCTAMKALSVSP